MATAAIAGGVSMTSAGGSKFALQNGTTLPLGCAVRIGSFMLPDASRDQTLATASDYATIKSWFQPLAESGSTSGIISQPNNTGLCLCTNAIPAVGDIFGSITNISSSYLTPGRRLYVWVFNHANPELATQWGIFTASTWLAPEALGTQVLSTTAAITALHGSIAEQQLRLRDIPTSYGNWIWKSYTTNALPQTTNASADPDHDGLANIAEYAWLLRPNAADQTRMSITKDVNGITFTFKRPRNIPDVTVTAECSPDLLNWSPASSSVIASDADFDTCQSTAAPGARCFWRVRFSSVATP